MFGPDWCSSGTHIIFNSVIWSWVAFAVHHFSSWLASVAPACD